MKNTSRSTWMPFGILLFFSTAIAEPESGPATNDADGQTYKTYNGNRDQFTLELPDGWYVFDQSPYSEHGIVAFYSEPVELKLDKDPEVARLQQVALITLMNDMTRGKKATFFADRYKADKGMDCSGFDARAQKRKVKIYSNADALGRKPKLVGQPEVSSVDFGGCQGMRVLLRANIQSGMTMQMLVYSAAVDGITYDFALLTEADYFERNLEWFERVMSSVRLTGASRVAKS